MAVHGFLLLFCPEELYQIVGAGAGTIACAGFWPEQVRLSLALALFGIIRVEIVRKVNEYSP
jgi:hypothetical protein